VAKKIIGELRGISRPLHLGSHIDEAENGFILRLTKDGGGKNAVYSSKTFVAPNEREALRIATTHFSGMGKLKGKSGRKKSARSKSSIKK
jgi:hypothetical protein